MQDVMQDSPRVRDVSSTGARFGAVLSALLTPDFAELLSGDANAARDASAALGSLFPAGPSKPDSMSNERRYRLQRVAQGAASQRRAQSPDSNARYLKLAAERREATAA